ncbi:MAG: HAD family hydrolase [Candidatus Thorarchaeota archaeon]
MSQSPLSSYCVIFDMDGVLADTGPIHFESWIKLGNEIGFEFTRDLFEQTFGQKSLIIIGRLIGSGVDRTLIEEYANRKEYYYRQMVMDKLKPLPGAIEIIKDLKCEGFKLALGSSGPPENVDLLLKSLKIKKCFDVMITATEVEKGKPEPDVFLIAAKALNINPENCIVIEDAPVGITAAKSAGMLSIALTTTHRREELFNADLIIKNLSEISIADIKRLLNINQN